MQLDKDNPWPGLESFEEDAHAFFFGRDREIKLLRDHVLDSQVTVLYGRSGLGKTSLLQAGLFPSLRERHLLPIYVRFDLKPGAAPLTQQLHHAVRDLIMADVSDPMLPLDSESLWEYLHRNDFELWSGRNYPLIPVIVLDQFEELFTLGERVPDLVDAFRNELGDLAENRIPADLATRIDSDEDVARRFNLRSRNYKLLISMREDFLPDLEGWCRLIPSLARSRVRLLHLRTNDALDAVHEPAAHMMTPDLARRVVGIIAGENLAQGRAPAAPELVFSDEQNPASDVEPALLSLFCRELNEERKRRGLARFDEQLIDEASRDTLSNYYSSCVKDLPDNVAEFIESELITEKGFRNSFIREDAVPSRITEDQLDRLISSRLVRLEDRYGAPRIELTHDVLTRAVREHRDKRRAEEGVATQMEGERQAAAQREAKLDRDRQVERERRLESEARAGRRFRWLSAALALATVVAVVMALLAFQARAKADAAARDETALRLIAESQTLLAGLGPTGINDVLGMQELLAALAIPSAHHGATSPLLTALYQERDLLKVIDVPEGVSSVAYSPDGTRIAAGSPDHTVRLWDAATGAPVEQALRHDDAVTSVAFSPDGTRIATGSADKTVRLWDAKTGQPIGQPLRHDEAVNTVAFSPDGTRIASGGQDKTVRLWNAETGQPIGQPLRHDDWVNSLAFSPDGTRIATAASTKVQMWNTATGQPIGQPLAHDDTVNSVAFSRDGTRIATASYNKTIRLWEATDGREIGVLRGHESPAMAVAFHPNGVYLVSSDKNSIRLWDTSWQPLPGNTDVAWAGYFDDGRLIGSGGGDKTVRWWDAATGRPIGPPLRVNNDDVKRLYPVDENRLVSYGTFDTMRMWDRAGNPIGQPLRLPPDPDRYLVPDRTVSRIAALLEPGVVQVYDTATMRRAGAPIRAEQPVGTIKFSADGRTVAIGSVDGTVQLWNSDTGAPVGKPMKGTGYVTTSLALSRDGHLLAVGCSCSSVQLWDTGTFKPVGYPMNMDSVPRTAAFSPDGRTLAAGADDGTIRLWNVGDQTQLGDPLTGHKSSVGSLYFSPDGTRLLSASDNDTIRIWPVLRPSTELLCAKLPHNMSREQWQTLVSVVDYIPACPNLPVADQAG